MGSRMASNLLKAGHPLTVHDLDTAMAATLLQAGATWAATPKAVAEASEVVLTSLPGPVEVEAVATGSDGVVEGLAAGAVYIDLSTGSPAVVRRIAERIKATGAHMLDAPVSGGPIGAEMGTLAVMVGGDEAVFQRVMPVLETIGAGISYIGGIGSGTVAKLVHNAISMSTRIVVQEGLALAVKAGVEPTKMLEVLRNGAFGKQVLLSEHIPDLVFKGDFDHPRFTLGMSHKDVSLALELAKEMDVTLSMAELADQEILLGVERGWASRDNLVTYLLAEERAGIEIRDLSDA
jgi:3-hydroxyisobutyrate dehydrogenase-like beta-hydroxyacid dehydrogenase